MKPLLAHLAWALLLTLLFEAVTVLFRFGLGLESARSTSFLSALTFGLRIHHGYLGAAMAVLSLALRPGSAGRTWGLRIGLALLGSDLVHHFLVMWPLTGHHELDLFYPSGGPSTSVSRP